MNSRINIIMDFSILQELADENDYTKNIFENMDDFFRCYFKKYAHDTYFLNLEQVDKEDTLICEIKHLQTGDVIHVKYMPYSQKYLDMYPDIYGKIFYISRDGNDLLIYRDIKKEGKIERYVTNINKPGCSYFGNSKGYDFIISKFI